MSGEPIEQPGQPMTESLAEKLGLSDPELRRYREQLARIEDAEQGEPSK